MNFKAFIYESNFSKKLIFFMSAKKVEKLYQKPKNKTLNPSSPLSQNATKSTKKMKQN